MRIISGRFKGRTLTSFDADHIRPTTDRVKESLFNKLYHRCGESFEEFVAADLFSGTGSLGLEALSRGIKHVTFVEMNGKSITILNKNLAMLKIDKTEHLIVKSDVRTYLKRFHGTPFDLIFVDPPFTEKMAHEVMECLSGSQCIKDGTIIAIESQKKERMESQYLDLIRFDLNDYGDKILSFFEKKRQDHC